jgi:hypothetical protein
MWYKYSAHTIVSICTILVDVVCKSNAFNDIGHVKWSSGRMVQLSNGVKYSNGSFVECWRMVEWFRCRTVSNCRSVKWCRMIERSVVVALYVMSLPFDSLGDATLAAWRFARNSHISPDVLGLRSRTILYNPLYVIVRF